MLEIDANPSFAEDMESNPFLEDDVLRFGTGWSGHGIGIASDGGGWRRS